MEEQKLPTLALRSLALELHVPCFERVLEFYRLLGFQEAWREEQYLVLKSGIDLIAFYGGSPSVVKHSYFSHFPSDTKRGYGVEVIVFVDDLFATLASLPDSTPVLAPIQLRPWGHRDFRIEDPFGYYLRVSERYDLSRATQNRATER